MTIHFNDTEYELFATQYAENGALAVIGETDEGERDVFTVNIFPDSQWLPSDEACIDTNNHPGIGHALIEAGIAEMTNKEFGSGFCIYPVMKFNVSKLNSKKED